MKKATLIFILVTLLSACTKDITSLNHDPINPTVVPSASLFTQAERTMSNTVVTSSIFTNIFRLWEQQWTETTYITESQYDLRDDGIPDDIWDAFYTGSLQNFEKAKSFMQTDVKDADVKTNDMAIADICEVYCYYYLVTTFGNIPYKDAFNSNILFPKFDDAATVYVALLTRLDTDIAALKPSAASFGAADFVYNGDVGKWVKFANTFKLKMGIILADIPGNNAKSIVEAAYNAGVFTSNADNALYQYVSTPPNTNPIWVDIIQSQRHDYAATDVYMNALNGDNDALRDPRTPYYFALNNKGVYVGAPNAEGTITAANYSAPSGPLLTAGSIGKLTNPDFPGDLLDYSETAFILAEAAARGYSVGGTAESYYKAAITASVEYWGGTADQATAYLGQPNVTFNGLNKATQLQSIAAQEYLAYYNRGWDEWTVNRRLDYPTIKPPPGAFSDWPVRMLYPVVEQTANLQNYNAAAAAMHGDKVSIKLFFDVN
jgi:hypothetical protein